MLTAIWSDIDNLLRNKEVTKKSVNINLCAECDGIKVICSEGLPVCSECGLVEDSFIDDNPEWTSGIMDDGKVNDPSRCGNPNASIELFSHNWGKSTLISTKSSSSYENKRMAKINFHMSMNHRDRSLFHAYRDMDEACHILPENVLKEAKVMYKKFNEEKLTRGAIRLGIKANCVLYACKLAKFPRTTKEVADMFGIKSKDVSRTTQIFQETIMGKTEKNFVTKPFDVMQRLLNLFDVSKEDRYKCNKMCNKLEECVELMSKTPNSIASAVILVALDNKIPKGEVCEKCSVSVPTINKILNIIKKYLEDKDDI
jgi:transcription initiation factor TFIIIB Brf1 subunit/transcription initiation factor TFIIB